MPLVLGLMFFCANGDYYAAASLLSDIAKDLNIPLSAAVLSVTAYMTAMGIFTLIFGPLSDGFGKVRVINTAAFGTAVLGYLSLTVLSDASHVFLSGIGLLGLGTVFIFIHSTLLSVIQEQLPDMNGTAMSIAGFNLYLGGACGTYLNATVMKVYGIETIFHNASFIFPAAALLAAIFVARFEIKRKQGKFCPVK